MWMESKSRTFLYLKVGDEEESIDPCCLNYFIVNE